MFDLSQPIETRKYLDAGKYLADVEAFEKKTSKAGNDYFSLKLKVNGAYVFENFNIFHQSDVPRNIALNKLRELILAQGFEASSLKSCTEEQLIKMVTSGAPMMVELSVFTDEFGTKNSVKKFFAVEKVEAAPF